MVAQNQISENIKRIMKREGLKVQEVAESAGISRVAFSAIKNGKTKEPRVSNLQIIAKVLGVRLYDLLVEPPSISTVRLRSKKPRPKIDNAKREQIIIGAGFWLKDFNYLESLLAKKRPYVFEEIESRIRSLRSNIPRKTAHLAREALNLDDHEPVQDIGGLLENAGVKIYTKSLDIENFFGFSIGPKDSGPAIGINFDENITVERKIFTAIHELGHLLLHPKAYDVSKLEENSKEENEADVFGGSFLVPDLGLEDAWKKAYGLGFVERVLHIKRIFKVSYLCILHRLADLKIIAVYDDAKSKFLDEYQKRYGEKLGEKDEPFPLAKIDFVEDRLPSLVREAIETEEISMSRGAEILGQSLTEMRKTAASWELAA